ncbi:MAG: lytic transglycosylase domain-containing protein [Acidobacteria bacterium]|nr:lytic transglycosylase domain-containing protein [Acidobacteriota bacterium]
MIANTEFLPAEDKIQAFVQPSGRIVFTNLVDNTPRPAVVDNTPQPAVVDNTPQPVAPVLPETIDVLAKEMPAALRALVDTISANHGVDAALVRAVMKTESNFNRWARSSKGALGLMQLIPSTGRRYGVRDFFDPQQNVEGGVRYLKFLLEKFNGNLDLSLAAYNAGENLVERLGRIPPITETTNYVRKIRAIYKKKAAPVAARPAMIAAVITPPTAVPAAPAAAPPAVKDEAPRIFRSVDERGIVHFSNIGPPN